MSEDDAVNAYVAERLASTIRLVRALPNELPKGIASGFVIPIEYRYRIISAGHAIGASPNWAVETLPVCATETLMLTVTNVQTVTTVRPKCESGALDIAWADLDPKSLGEQLKTAPKMPGKPIELPLYTGPLDLVPDERTPYGFAAWNRVEFHPAISTLLREASYEIYMSYEGIERDTGLYRFHLGRPHQGRAYYEGASGAPITDPEGKIVSMLVCGNEESDILFGVPLADHAAKLLAAVTAEAY